ncbi:E3 SUMO-protein ligase NSE2 [Triplophysa tibetana]|uniref:E3 SUMO-protein ligase NSE2 n=1 Tax=Triplophysa tibetana TaxID=1572043 RepID=A0A5A9MZW7_9TELE|nr:E3 SUMO-protein ligase NSE2 [Triplophysa tibetana]
MSLSSVQSTLSNLKSCQGDIDAYMDVVSDVALGIVEAEGTTDSPALKKLEKMMLQCSELDREINCFVGSVEEMTAQVRHQPPDAMFNLRASVKDRFSQVMGGVSDADLQRHTKVIAFKESIRKYAMQASQAATENDEEELDDDIAFTQSETNFTCPLTKVEMVNPVKNKKCQHYFDQEAILEMIRARHRNKKKCRCPNVGCGNTDFQESDLELDFVMKRKIQNQKRQSAKT